MSYQRYDDSFLQQYIKAFLQIRPSKMVLSFSEDAAILEEVRQKQEQTLGKVAVMPKIETQAGAEHCGSLYIVAFFHYTEDEDYSRRMWCSKGR